MWRIKWTLYNVVFFFFFCIHVDIDAWINHIYWSRTLFSFAMTFSCWQGIGMFLFFAFIFWFWYNQKLLKHSVSFISFLVFHGNPFFFNPPPHQIKNCKMLKIREIIFLLLMSSAGEGWKTRLIVSLVIHVEPLSLGDNSTRCI